MAGGEALCAGGRKWGVERSLSRSRRRAPRSAVRPCCRGRIAAWRWRATPCSSSAPWTAESTLCREPPARCSGPLTRVGRWWARPSSRGWRQPRRRATPSQRSATTAPEATQTPLVAAPGRAPGRGQGISRGRGNIEGGGSSSSSSSMRRATTSGAIEGRRQGRPPAQAGDGLGTRPTRRRLVHLPAAPLPMARWTEAGWWSTRRKGRRRPRARGGQSLRPIGASGPPSQRPLPPLAAGVQQRRPMQPRGWRLPRRRCRAPPRRRWWRRRASHVRAAARATRPACRRLPPPPPPPPPRPRTLGRRRHRRRRRRCRPRHVGRCFRHGSNRRVIHGARDRRGRRRWAP